MVSLEQLGTGVKFVSMDQLHTELSALKCFGGMGYQCEYIVPGDGLKGKQQLLVTTEDLATMYGDYKRKQIRLWVKRLQGKRHSHSPPKSDAPSAKVRKTKYDVRGGGDTGGFEGEA